MNKKLVALAIAVALIGTYHAAPLKRFNEVAEHNKGHSLNKRWIFEQIDSDSDAEDQKASLQKRWFFGEDSSEENEQKYGVKTSSDSEAEEYAKEHGKLQRRWFFGKDSSEENEEKYGLETSSDSEAEEYAKKNGKLQRRWFGKDSSEENEETYGLKTSSESEAEKHASEQTKRELDQVYAQEPSGNDLESDIQPQGDDVYAAEHDYQGYDDEFNPDYMDSYYIEDDGFVGGMQDEYGTLQKRSVLFKRSQVDERSIWRRMGTHVNPFDNSEEENLQQYGLEDSDYSDAFEHKHGTSDADDVEQSAEKDESQVNDAPEEPEANQEYEEQDVPQEYEEQDFTQAAELMPEEM